MNRYKVYRVDPPLVGHLTPQLVLLCDFPAALDAIKAAEEGRNTVVIDAIKENPAWLDDPAAKVWP